MNTDVAISVKKLSKCYRVYEAPSDRLKQGLQRLWGGKKLYGRDFWALRDVSFEMKKGECLGVLGRNGAGKSTLLQLIAGTLEPTYGTLQVNGVVAALLELGSGFNPEFTGRENVFLNATILGLSTESINNALDDILAFADIGEFIEQPVKNYSSGMLMRLAFAVQTAVQPSVLIVDEALSVGDARFQRKCFERMNRLKESGTTILFVTHDSGTVVQICDRAIIIEGGRLYDQGEPQLMAKIYHRLLFGEGNSHDAKAEVSKFSVNAEAKADAHDGISEKRVDSTLDSSISGDREVRYGSKDVEITDITIIDAQGASTSYLLVNQTYEFQFRVRYNRDIASGVAFGFIISNVRGIEIYATKGALHGLFLRAGKKGEQFECAMRLVMLLTPGVYFLSAAVAPGDDSKQDEAHFYDVKFDALEFRVAGKVRCHATSIVELNADLTWNSI
ncbi:ABC transporter ATP-binding protein [Methyloterricola oryzae]|uniref:ABC transporter ATP-binding protein n=1 Tax=Methyloterricola oryzae TaxID=1495050 RepID=UPI0005EAD53E|nr:ABC transporter ATP-binding protein [Methyloterricola oryzae]